MVKKDDAKITEWEVTSDANFLRKSYGKGHRWDIRASEVSPDGEDSSCIDSI